MGLHRENLFVKLILLLPSAVTDCEDPRNYQTFWHIFLEIWRIFLKFPIKSGNFWGFHYRFTNQL